MVNVVTTYSQVKEITSSAFLQRHWDIVAVPGDHLQIWSQDYGQKHLLEDFVHDFG